MRWHFFLALLVCVSAKSSFIEHCPPGGNSCFYEGSPTYLDLGYVGDPGADRWFDLGNPTRDVAKMVLDWQPDFILSCGDNSYFWGYPRNMEESMANYASYIKYPNGSNATGAPGSPIQRFWTAVGNHEWGRGGVDSNCMPKTHMDFFSTYPGNTRYFSVRFGCPDATGANCLVELFVLSHNNTRGEACNEPDGTTLNSVQGAWFRAAKAASTATWKIVIGHIPPYTSGPKNYPNVASVLTWQPELGDIDLQLAGDDHVYERLMNRTYGPAIIVNGISGMRQQEPNPFYMHPRGGSVSQWGYDFGANRFKVTPTTLTSTFVSRVGVLVDKFQIVKQSGQPNKWVEMTEPSFTQKWGFPAQGTIANLRDADLNLGWHTGSSYGEQTFNVGTMLVMYWNDRTSNVWRYESKAKFDQCDSTGGQMMQISGLNFPDGPLQGVWGASNGKTTAAEYRWTNAYWFPLNKAGTWYLADTNGCANGQKLTLKVVDPDSNSGFSGFGGNEYVVNFNN